MLGIYKPSIPSERGMIPEKLFDSVGRVGWLKDNVPDINGVVEESQFLYTFEQIHECKPCLSFFICRVL